MTTNVPAIEFTTSGLVLPSQQAILAGTQADLNAAFGGNLNQALNTPQGQMASTLAAIIADKDSQIAQISNMIDPATASGRWQDAIGYIYFMERIQAQGTVVQATCYGLSGTIIYAGALAQDINGNIYESTSAGTIGIGGSVVLNFVCQTKGAIICNIGALNSIYQAITGWSSIANLTAGVVGNEVESRSAFEQRRQASVAINSTGSMGAIFANVMNLDGVLDCYVYENNTGSPISVGSTTYSIAANSVYVAVVGGVAADVAKAIWERKSCGCDYNGNTTVTVYDETYSFPYPEYTVKFNIPTNTPVIFSIEIQNNPNLPSDIITLVKNAVIAAFNGTDGGTRARIGGTITSGRFFAGIAATSQYCNVLSVLMGLTTPTLTSVQMGIDEEPTITDTNITVTLI